MDISGMGVNVGIKVFQSNEKWWAIRKLISERVGAGRSLNYRGHVGSETSEILAVIPDW
jgi:hypothetical protein